LFEDDMPITLRSLTLTLAVLAGTGLVLSGCGRKPELYAPGQAPTKTGDTEARAKERAKIPERPFILDPLL
jgi:predicted small lipoprotein YifL